MSRPYLNLIVYDFSSRIYSLCGVDVCKHLFYRVSETARRAAQIAKENKDKRGEFAVMGRWRKLPPAAINFQESPSTLSTSTAYLFSLLGGESNILYSDSRCQTVLYNPDLKFLDAFVPPNSCKSPNAISIPIYITPAADCDDDPLKLRSQSLYVLDLSPTAEVSSSFEVLSCRSKNAHSHNHPAVPEEWGWDILPSPPFLSDTETSPNLYSYAVVDGSTIFISSLQQQLVGTYTFDTVTNYWRQAARWALPFFGKAEYFPELKLWFGLSPSKPVSSLCAFDLSGTVSAQPPTLHHAWDYLDLPQDRPWTPSQLHLIHLGSGKFCVATFFGTMMSTSVMPPYDDSDEYSFHKECAVFTGLEVKRSNDGEGPPELINHMSKRFSVGSRNIMCVL